VRVWIGGPRILGMRTGVSLGREDFQSLRGSTQVKGSKPTPAFIYVIQDVENRVKVGITADPASRLNALQTTSATKLTLLYVAAVKSSDAFAVEQVAHGILSKSRQSGEWFLAAPEVAVAAINAASFRIKDPIINVPLDQVQKIVQLASMSSGQLKASNSMSALMILAKIVSFIIIGVASLAITLIVYLLVKGT
jgi:hypothetical protein